MSSFAINPVLSTQPADKPCAPVRNDGRFSSSQPAPKRYYDSAVCEGPSCTNVIPAGFYPAQRTRSFCSKTCRGRDSSSRYVVGTCPHCGGPVMGRKDEAG